MAGRIPRDFIDGLIQRIDIVDLINQHLPLKKSGSNYLARCPFHEEKTPSFTVNREKQFFYCFGCGATGNAFGFLMDHGNLGFVEAVEDAASFAGIEVPRDAENDASTVQTHKLEALYAIQSKVATYYQNQLFRGDNKAKRYLKQRGLNGEIVKRYNVGYSPPDWNDLCDHFDQDLLIEIGLLIRNEHGNIYNRFRNRIMFPIRDRRGRVIGFGGRVIDDSSPKYLNSPETITFLKGKEVYGLHELLEVCPRPSRILITEGYLDVIGLAQCGIPFSVATLGTATSRYHIDLLFRFSSELVFCFDGDKAGQKAAWRALETALPGLSDNRKIRIVILPPGHDPDSLVRSEGKEFFIQQIKESKLLSDYFFDTICKNSNLSVIEERNAVVQAAKPLLTKIPNGVFRDMMFARLGELTRLDRVELDKISAAKSKKKKNSSIRQRRIKPSAMRTAIALLLQHPQLGMNTELIESDWAKGDLAGLGLLKQLVAIIKANPDIHAGGILEKFRERPEKKHLEKLILWELLVPQQGIENEFADAIQRIHKQLNNQILKNLLKRANNLNDSERKKMQELLSNSKDK